MLQDVSENGQGLAGDGQLLRFAPIQRHGALAAKVGLIFADNGWTAAGLAGVFYGRRCTFDGVNFQRVDGDGSFATWAAELPFLDRAPADRNAAHPTEEIGKFDFGM